MNESPSRDEHPGTSDPSTGHDADSSVDTLTGLTSRVGLEAWLKAFEAHAQTPPDDRSLSLIAVAISRFGSVNVSMGPALGDRIIIALSKRLRKIFRNAELIARTHGDHFCLLFRDGVNVEEQIELLEDFAQRPLAVGGEVIVMSVQMGIASIGASVNSAVELLHAGEVALHRAKSSRLRRCVYDSEMDVEARAAHRLENDLRVSLVTRHFELHRALNNDEFLVFYQPIIDAGRCTVHALEALIRWKHPTRGFLAPAHFIPMAEQIRVIDVLGIWIMRRACLDAMSLPPGRDGTRPGVSVNVSPSQFLEPQILIEGVRQALKESGLAPQMLKLEITESAALGADKLGSLGMLRSLGCQIALDDFGTGYSSLTQLNEMPLDYLKLDRSFVSALAGADAAADQRCDRMTRAVLSIAEVLELTPIIEGVETAQQRDRLLRLGANLMQGYFFAKPAPLAQTSQFIADFESTAPKTHHA